MTFVALPRGYHQGQLIRVSQHARTVLSHASDGEGVSAAATHATQTLLPFLGNHRQACTGYKATERQRPCAAEPRTCGRASTFGESILAGPWRKDGIRGLQALRCWAVSSEVREARLHFGVVGARIRPCAAWRWLRRPRLNEDCLGYAVQVCNVDLVVAGAVQFSVQFSWKSLRPCGWQWAAVRTPACSDNSPPWGRWSCGA